MPSRLFWIIVQEPGRILYISQCANLSSKPKGITFEAPRIANRTAVEAYTTGMGWRRMLDSREGEPDEYSSRGTRTGAACLHEGLWL